MITHEVYWLPIILETLSSCQFQSLLLHFKVHFHLMCLVHILIFLGLEIETVLQTKEVNCYVFFG
jgi:hypothetical protein